MGQCKKCGHVGDDPYECGCIPEPFRCGECGGELRDHVCIDCGTRHGDAKAEWERELRRMPWLGETQGG